MADSERCSAPRDEHNALEACVLGSAPAVQTSTQVSARVKIKEQWTKRPLSVAPSVISRGDRVSLRDVTLPLPALSALER